MNPRSSLRVPRVCMIDQAAFQRMSSVDSIADAA